MASKYSVEIDELKPNTAHGIVLNSIRPGSKVLECGSSSGYMTKYMKEVLHAQVSIVELNPADFDDAMAFACDGFCGDLEQEGWSAYYTGKLFDYIIFADVLEHLRNPQSVLNRAVALLKEDGTIIASVPNVAHHDILINLLDNRWNYQPLGLLDNTHIHFWGKDALDAFFAEAKLRIVDRNYTIMSAFTSEQAFHGDTDKIAPAIHTICQRPYGDVYQYIYSAQKESYVKEHGIECADHYMQQHGAYESKPPCFFEYEQKLHGLAQLTDANAALTRDNASLTDANAALARDNASLTDTNAALTRDNASLTDANAALTRDNASLTDANAALARDKASLTDANAVLARDKASLTDANAALTRDNASLTDANAALTRDNASLTDANENLTGAQAQAEQELQYLRTMRANALSQLETMLGTRTFRLLHLLYRFYKQGLSRDRAERKAFRRWLSARLRHKYDEGINDHRFSSLYGVIDILNVPMPTVQDAVLPVPSNSKLAEHLLGQSDLYARQLHAPLSEEAQKLRRAMEERQYKGILVYPHVVFWEPLQTPQQLLRAFAKTGWLCFFCESPYHEGDVRREVEPNLFITYEADLLQAIGSREVSVLLTWMGSMSFVNALPNKTIWYHILDHLEIFSYYDALYERLHQQTLQDASVISYVATPLKAQYHLPENAIYLPNGVHPDDILEAIHPDFVPEDMKPILKKQHRIIGYYGYLAEWMDYAMVRWLAKSRPEWEFVFVGKAIHDTSLIENLPNVHLLGLKPYKELFDYAKYFDVATVPFLVDEKMDCVSPIKFYEYLSLGKPVVSSAMPEIAQYAENYSFVFNANGREEFLRCLERALSEEVRETAKTQAPELGQKNSWLARARRIEEPLAKAGAGALSQEYCKADVIILSIIDYHFRHQRPQHFAQRMAAQGHRVFYLDANFAPSYSSEEIAENLWEIKLPGARYPSIHLTDLSDQRSEMKAMLDQFMRKNFIRDAVVIVDYPHWVYAAEYLRDKYGLKLITDYMDDFTGFVNPTQRLVKENCIRLLRESDAVVASSRFLCDVAQKYNDNVTAIRNGTEYAYFHQAYAAAAAPRARSVIGYYGAIAEWFNAEVVCRCAERFPECDIVLVGAVTAHREVLSKHPNIRLVGEVPYQELLPWLRSFDVCLIPFDSSTDLIKATNPVKFYEYLSAGKKVVATEIPELEPYRDRFALLENDPDKFCDAVERCLLGTDGLADTEEMFAFAEANDWDQRASAFLSTALSVCPKISIVVLCYNQLDYTRQCVDSILHNTAYPNYELIMVDNNSSDDTAEYLKELDKQYEQVKIVLNTTNRGFAGGNNDGIAVSDGDYIVLLNNDTLVTRGWLTGLVKHYDEDGKVALVGPVTNSIGNEGKIRVDYASVEDMPNFAFAYTQQHMGEEYPHHGVLAMYCLMISRAFYEEAGPLDENYGVGMFEDDDYSVAATSLGFRTVMAEDVFIHHYGTVSFKKLENETYRALFEKNKAYFEKKWNTTWKMHIARPGAFD